MNTGEELIEPSSPNPEGYGTQFNVIAQLGECGEALKLAIGKATTDPTREVVANIYETVETAKGLINNLYRADFYKASGEEWLVSAAIAALVNNIKEAFVCMQILVPGATPNVDIIAEPVIDDSFNLPSLKIELDTESDLPAQQAQTAEIIGEFADVILRRDARGADLISKDFAKIASESYDALINGLAINPVTKEFLKKEARKKELIENAKKVGMVAVPAFAGTLAAHFAKDFLTRKRK